MLEKLCNSNPLLIEDLTIDILTQSYSQQDYDFFSELIDTYNQFDEHQFQEYIEKISDHQAKAISIYHPDYPKRLKKISNPPLMIFTRGKLFDFSRSIAIVGRRKPSTQAKTLAFKLAKILTERKYKIISGLAIGIDAEAHKGCLAAGGLTTAVLATPITNISPKMNIDIARSILKTGCIISERIVLTRSDKLKIRSYFPLRNRIISGLSDIVVVAESNDRGGTIRQIDYAISQQKPVLYYVPPQNHEHYPIAKAIVTKYSDYIHPFYSVEEAIDMIETYIDLINYKNMNFSNSNIQFKFYPPLPLLHKIQFTKEAREYLWKHQDRFSKIIEIANFIITIDDKNNTSKHIIDILRDPESMDIVIQYLILTNKKRNRLGYQQEIVQRVIEEFPDEEFVDFMIRVLYE